MIGRKGAGQVAITGEIARRMVHIMRAQSDAIMVGAGTVAADDPDLTCRLPGLEKRSPVRIVLDGNCAFTAIPNWSNPRRDVPVWIAGFGVCRRRETRRIPSCGLPHSCLAKIIDGKIALPELLEDLGAKA